MKTFLLKVFYKKKGKLCKTRIISENKHQLRVDEEDTFPIINESDFIKHSIDLMSNVHVVIFQDYNKGVLTKHVINSLVEFATKKQIPTLVDPNRKLLAIQGVSLFKPNAKELIESNSEKEALSLENISKIVTKQRKQLNAELFLVTLSEKGVFIQIENEEEHHYPAYKRTIIDVSGAGDAVIATAALALAQKLDYHILAKLANLAGGLSCENVGVNPIDRRNLLNEAIRLI